MRTASFTTIHLRAEPRGKPVRYGDPEAPPVNDSENGVAATFHE